MCQVYYVSSFIELIYFVAVAFNQGCFTQTVEGWSGGGGWGGVTCTGVGVMHAVVSLEEMTQQKKRMCW